MFAFLHSFHFLHPSPPLSSRKPQFSNGTGVPPTKAEKLAFLRKCLLKTRKRVFSFQNACKGFSLRRKESTQLKIFSSIDIFNQTTQLKTFSWKDIFTWPTKLKIFSLKDIFTGWGVADCLVVSFVETQIKTYICLVLQPSKYAIFKVVLQR